MHWKGPHIIEPNLSVWSLFDRCSGRRGRYHPPPGAQAFSAHFFHLNHHALSKKHSVMSQSVHCNGVMVQWCIPVLHSML